MKWILSRRFRTPKSRIMNPDNVKKVIQRVNKKVKLNRSKRRSRRRRMMSHSLPPPSRRESTN